MKIVVPGTRMLARIWDETTFAMIPDFTTGPIDKREFATLMKGENAKVQHLINQNCNAHAPFVNSDTSINSLAGSEKGGTVVFILSGPSAAGINKRLQALRDEGHDFKIATINNSCKAVDHSDYYFCFEQIAYPEWYEHLDPSKTHLITTPCAEQQLGQKWAGRNVSYGYMGDMHQSTDPRWDCLPLMVSALTTACPALQTLYLMGFQNIFVIGGDFCIYHPRTSPANPRIVAQGTFYWNGLKYNFQHDADIFDKSRCYFDNLPFFIAMSITSDFYDIEKYKAQVESIEDPEARKLFIENFTDSNLIGVRPDFLRYKNAVKCCMEMIHDRGVNIRNCARFGALDFRFDLGLEEAFTDIAMESMAAGVMSDALCEAQA